MCCQLSPLWHERDPLSPARAPKVPCACPALVSAVFFHDPAARSRSSDLRLSWARFDESFSHTSGPSSPAWFASQNSFGSLFFLSCPVATIVNCYLLPASLSLNKTHRPADPPHAMRQRIEAFISKEVDPSSRAYPGSMMSHSPLEPFHPFRPSSHSEIGPGPSHHPVETGGHDSTRARKAPGEPATLSRCNH